MCEREFEWAPKMKYQNMRPLADSSDFSVQSLNVTKGVRNTENTEISEDMKGKNLLSLVRALHWSDMRGKSATRSMILPWFREFVHVPVWQHNNSAGNQINKSRSQTQIPWYRHTPRSFHSLFSHGIFLTNPEEHSTNEWNDIAQICHFQMLDWILCYRASFVFFFSSLLWWQCCLTTMFEVAQENS